MYGYADINIGDIVKTKTNTVGKVVSLDSVTNVNNDYDRNHKNGWAKVMANGVQEDEVRRPDVWYGTVFILVKPTDGSKPYIEASDFPDIVAVDKPGVTFWSKLAALFK